MTLIENPSFLGPVETDAGKYLDRLNKMGISRIFDREYPVLGDPDFANQNVLDALPIMMDSIESDANLMLVFGPMASGKSTAMAKLYRQLVGIDRQVVVWKHTFDEARVGKGKRLWLQGGNDGITTDIGTSLYYGPEDILDANSNQWSTGSVHLIDEFMFAGTGNPPKIDITSMDKLINRARADGVKLVIAGLHSDFKKHVWPNIASVVYAVDMGVFDFRGRCDADDCENNSIFTQRWVALENEGEVVAVRASHSKEVVVRVGSVLGSDDYQPVCDEHHLVLEPNDAREFDLSYGKNSGDYH